MTNIRRLVSSRLRELRGDRTQEALAKRAGLSVHVIGKIERQETTPSLETLHRLCSALGITLGEFFATAGPSKNSRQVLEALTLYLQAKRPDHVQFADRLVREVITRLETETKRRR